MQIKISDNPKSSRPGSLNRRELLKISPLFLVGGLGFPKLRDPLLRGGVAFTDWASARWFRLNHLPPTTGEIETEDGVLVIGRIPVEMHLAAPEESRQTVERVHGIYAMNCPLYRTLHNAIQLTSSYTLTGQQRT